MEKLAVTLALLLCCTVVAVKGSENMELPKCGSDEMVHKGEFTPYDYSAVGFMLVVSLGIGVFYGYFEKSKKEDVESPTSNDFLLGTGMTVFPVTLSLTTSFITAIELLGNPSEMFFSGTQYALIVISALLVIPVAVKLFFPIYYKMNLTSCYEYLGSRFDKRIRIFGAILYILQMSFYTSVAVLAPAIALSKATGLDTHVAVVLIYFVCVFYSSQGGMKAVVIADTFQACILALSLVLVVGLGSYYTGGPAEIFTRADENSRIELFNTSTNPTTRHSIFSVVIGGFFYWTSLFCTNQASVQKCMSLKSIKKATTAISFAILGLVLVFLFNFYTGLMTYAHYHECDPLRSGQISEKDQLVPFYVMDVFGHVPSMTGIFVAGIFAASLGTVAAALNSLSAVTCEDILVTGIGMKLSPERSSKYAKWMSLGYGIFSFGLVFVVERLGGILQATLTLNGLIGGVTLGLFSLGIFFRNANSKGALYGGILSLVFVVYLGVMAQIDGEPVVFLPSSMEACNCTQSSSPSSALSVSSILSDHHSRGLLYDRIGDGPVSMALVAMDPSGALSTVGGTLVGDKVLPAGSAGSMEIMSRTATNESPLASVYRISYMWYSFLGCFLTVFFGFVISLMTGGISFCGSKQTVNLVSTLRESFKQNGSFHEYNKHKLGEDEPRLQRKSITRDDSIRIQVGAPLTMMMKTSVSSSSSKKSMKPKGTTTPKDEASIYSIEGHGNQTNSMSPGSLALEVERGKF